MNHQRAQVTGNNDHFQMCIPVNLLHADKSLSQQLLRFFICSLLHVHPAQCSNASQRHWVASTKASPGLVGNILEQKLGFSVFACVQSET